MKTNVFVKIALEYWVDLDESQEWYRGFMVNSRFPTLQGWESDIRLDTIKEYWGEE